MDLLVLRRDCGDLTLLLQVAKFAGTEREMWGKI